MDSIPDDIAAVLKRAGLTAFFADCTEAHRREYLKWIGEAKRPETRKARLQETVRRLTRRKQEEESKSGKRG